MVDKQLTSIIQDSFLQFAGAVLQSRALVDVRDCLKPSARQIFYCMETDGFVHSKPFQKALKSIGSCFRLYIHGDSSAEGVIMRAGQPFAMRYPLVEIEGSYGTLLSSGSWSAPRYTSSRLSKLSEYLFSAIKKDTISEWRDNYDNTEQYPAVLPSKGFYNLVNGSFGLGVGASSSIPQYNIKELNNALIYLIDNPNCDFDDIFVMPDFATGGIIINGDEIKESHRYGQGKACKIRSVVEWDNKDRCFIVTEIPFMVYTDTICQQLEDIINGEENPGIERFNDLTGEKPLIKIYLEKKANPDKILKFLYKNTSLESYYGVNFTMLDNGGRFPRVFTWKETLQAHINHEREVYRKEFEFDLKKIENRIHIIDGILICLASINEVIQVIKSSASTIAAATALQTQFLLDEAQTKAVLDMKLGRLAHLEVKKLEDERAELQKESTRIHSILSDDELFKNELKNGWRAVANEFGDARRTKVQNLQKDSNDEIIEQKQLSITCTSEGAIFASEASTLYVQKRNGVGAKFKLDNGESIIDNIVCQSGDSILFFTAKGNYFHLRASELPLDTKTYLTTIMPGFSNEKLLALSAVTKQTSAQNIVFVTKKGIIKKSDFSEYNLRRTGGAQAIKLDDGDEIVSVSLMKDEVMGILTHNGLMAIITTSDIKSIGRTTRGVEGISLDNDYVVDAKPICAGAKSICSINEEGYIKASALTDFRITKRGAKGVKIGGINLVAFIVDADNDILVTSTVSQIRIAHKDIPIVIRGAAGNRAIKLPENAKIQTISKI